MNLFAEWARVKPLLLPAIERTNGTHTADDVLLMLGAGQLTLWPGENSAIVTEFIEYPRMKVVNFFLVGGDLNELLAMRPKIEAWARAHGCARVICMGRAGWRRVMPDYKFSSTHLYKDI